MLRRVIGVEMFSVFFTGIGRVIFPDLNFLEAVEMLFIRAVIDPLLMFLHVVKFMMEGFYKNKNLEYFFNNLILMVSYL